MPANNPFESPNRRDARSLRNMISILDCGSCQFKLLYHNALKSGDARQMTWANQQRAELLSELAKVNENLKNFETSYQGKLLESIKKACDKEIMLFAVELQSS